MTCLESEKPVFQGDQPVSLDKQAPGYNTTEPWLMVTLKAFSSPRRVWEKAIQASSTFVDNMTKWPRQAVPSVQTGVCRLGVVFSGVYSVHIIS